MAMQSIDDSIRNVRLNNLMERVDVRKKNRARMRRDDTKRGGGG